MSGLFVKGEEKVRAGVYRRHEKIDGNTVAAAMNGVFCIPVHADWGPLGVVQEITSKSALASMYMNGGTIDAAEALFDAGAVTVYVYRMGSGGTKGTVKIQNSTGTDAVTLATRYETNIALSVTIKQKLGDSATKECSIYDGNVLLEKIAFAAGEGEIDALIEKMKNSQYLTATKEDGANGTLQDVSQKKLSSGTAPTVNNGEYSNAFTAFETLRWNVLVLDTVDDEVQATAKAFMERIHDNGAIGICVIGEASSSALSTRIDNAKAYNAPYFVYCGSGYVDTAGNTMDGYLSVAIQAGVIGSKDSSQSIVHTVIPGAASCIEKLTNQQYEDAIKAGLLLLSEGYDGQVWFDSGVNTYTVLAEEDDEGWKKIKRTAVRNEAFDRIDRTLEPLIGKINCDDDGVDNVIQQAKAVLAQMALEKKILDTYDFYEDSDNPHAADHAHFIIKIDDIDSLEKIYLTYQFRYVAS